MCGISGYISFKGLVVDPSLVHNMNSSIAHRGPDDDGFYFENQIGFGHRRLSILDLSVEGHQPMKSTSSECVIIYNGEIYNYLEIQTELISIGYQFSSKSDTEVILKAYEAWGDECVSKFNGMWSFAIYDPKRSRVFCSRDHFGIKPFYYTKLSDGIAFGSEIRQLTPFLSRIEANIPVVKAFLFATITEHKEETFYNGVFKLPGGHNVIFDLETDTFEIIRYYNLTQDDKIKDLNLSESIKVFGDSLIESIKLRLRSDVTVGTCLSGGLDSSSVATIAAKFYQQDSGKKFSAITAISEDETKDESSFAKTVVKDSNLNWITTKPDYNTFKSNIREVVKAQEEPFPTVSILMQYEVMKIAKENNITVLLDGQGGDETLLGYERYYSPYLLNVFKEKGLLTAIKSALRSKRNNALMTPINIIKYFIYFSSARIRYRNYVKRAKYMKDIPAFPFGMRFENDDFWDLFDMQKKEVTEYNLPALLKYEDKNSMWNSIETRLPFLDPNTLKIALSLPVSVKIYDGWTKYVLRKLMDGKMSDSITWRKNKFGFEGPDVQWISKHSHEIYNVVMKSKLLHLLTHMGTLKTSFNKLDHSIKWKLYSVALWEEEFKIQLPN